MPYKSSHLKLQEEDAIRLVLEFLSNRDLNISQLSVERETGVFNGIFSDDLLFLRQLILDGQWDDVLQFVQPLESIQTFNQKEFKYLINKHKYIELLCIRSEAGPLQNVEIAVSEVVSALEQLEQLCPHKEDYNELCLLLTLPNLSDHKDFKHWNPSNWRINCFKAVLPLIEKYLPPDKKSSNDSTLKTSKGDRLMQLIIKGILYESCVEYCQQKATTFPDNKNVTQMKYSSLLDGTGFSNSDLSLLSWLQSIPPETFSCPFEQKTLNVEVEQLEKPSLVAHWSELILITPIKPKVFPHSATPFTRRKASDLMSKSLTPGLVDGLSTSLMGFSISDMAAMSRSSFAATGFHLNSSNNLNKKGSQTSVDRLFEGEVFSSTCFETLPTIHEKPSPVSTTLVEESKFLSHKENEPQISTQSSTPKSAKDLNQSQNTPDLWQKFQKEKQKLMEKLMNEEMITSSAGNSGMLSSARNTAKSINQSYIQTPQICPIGSSTDEKVTPIGQTGHSNIPNLEKLTTSTPKGNHIRFREATSFSPNQSPILAATQNGLSQQRNLSFNSSANEVLTTNSSIILHQSSLPQTSNSSQMPNINRQMHGPNSSFRSNISTDLSGRKPKFVAVTRLEDAQAIRAAEFHPNGQLYAIGSNSKTLRICGYPKQHELRTLREDHEPHQPTVLSKRLKHHKGSIYCLAWNTTGDLLATGSNDKTIKMMRFNSDNSEIEGGEADLTMHDGTIRDLCFMEDLTNRSSLLISGGAGDCKIYVTDCDTATPFQALSGHSGHILSLHTWGGAMFVSGSADRTIRFWDLRTRGCVNLITAPPASGSGPGSAVAAVCVDPSGKLLVSGHEDSNCMLYDIRGGRIIQTFQPHSSDIRTIRFSNKAYYLLTGGYDNKIVLTDLQGDLTQPLPSVVVAEHTDKVIQGRWHPTDFTFLTTSADKSATLWALPNN